MSAEADFGLSGWVWQAHGSQVSWDLTWSGVIAEDRFVAVSFMSDFDITWQLVRVSEWFSSNGPLFPHVGELIRCNEPEFRRGVPFRFAVVVIPNH
jgi:hypothetical protein